MAGRPIVIEFASNVRDYLRGTRDVERSTDDIGESLKDASKDADRFEREFRDSMKDAERQADKSARKIEQDFDRAGDEMSEVGREAGDEFKQNLGESLASGDIEGILQDTLGGLVASLKGPVGLAAAGLAAVAAVAFNEVRKQAELWAEGIEGIVEGLDESIDVITGKMTRAQRLEQYGQWLEDNKDLLTEIAGLADEAGVSADEYATALYFGGDAADDLRSYLQDVVAEGTTMVGNANNITENLDDSAIAANDLIDRLDGADRATSELRAQQELVNDAYAEGKALIDGYNAGAATLEERFRRVRGHVDALSQQRRTVWLDFRATGDAAAYVTRGNANYSPAYVAVDNIYKQGG